MSRERPEGPKAEKAGPGFPLKLSEAHPLWWHLSVHLLSGRPRGLLQPATTTRLWSLAPFPVTTTLDALGCPELAWLK